MQPEVICTFFFKKKNKHGRYMIGTLQFNSCPLALGTNPFDHGCTICQVVPMEEGSISSDSRSPDP